MILLLAKEGITTITYDLMSRLLVQQAVAALKGLNQALYPMNYSVKRWLTVRILRKQY